VGVPFAKPPSNAIRRASEFQKNQPPTRSEHAPHLSKSTIEIRKVPNPEGAGDDRKARVGKGEIEGIAGTPARGRLTSLKCSLQHFAREIAAGDGTRSGTPERSGQVSGPAGEVKHIISRLDLRKPDSLSAPCAIATDAKE